MPSQKEKDFVRNVCKAAELKWRSNEIDGDTYVKLCRHGRGAPDALSSCRTDAIRSQEGEDDPDLLELTTSSILCMPRGIQSRLLL